MRQKSYLLLALVLVLGVLSGYIYTLKPYKYGLDIQGGVQFTYRMDTSKLSEDQKQNIGLVRTHLIQILENRAHGPMGVTEPTVLAKGSDQFVVELPGVKDLDEAEKVMGSSARVEMYWARNVQTSKRSFVRYQSIESKSDNPSVQFYDTLTHKTIVEGTPEYKAVIADWQLIIKGDEVKNAQPEAYGGGYIPSMTFSSTGSEKMATWSREHPNEHAMLATVLDGNVLSIAGLQDGAILSEGANISPGAGTTFNPVWVTSLCNLINAGSLPVDLIPLSAQKVDATIGEQALSKMVTSGIVAFVVIAIFLVGYYAFPGIVALLALMLYVLFTLSVLKLIGATFSLAGIAGFILSVGMAVDANILVFERVKEEVKNGKKLDSAIVLGFKRALNAIADSNACTILTSLVLLNLGTGPVKGFATTLIIGVLISLFTAVTVTRSLLVFSIGSGLVTNPKWFALNRNWFGKRFDIEHGGALDVVRKAKKWFIISGATVVVCIPFFFPPLSGFRLNVEFQGGYDATYPITANAPSTDVMTANLEKAGFRGSNVKIITADQGVRFADITVPPEASLANAKDNTTRGAAIATAAGIPGVAYNEFSSVGPTVQQETLQNAIEGVVVSSALIIIYLAVRFGTGFGGLAAGFRFGAAAIGALLHDILVVIGTAAIVGYVFKWEVSALFLTAMLTIIGFSVHDTIVIFDRIRENLHQQQTGEDFRHLVDRSITQSFARSINTSGTVIVTLLILVTVGTATPELKFFVAAMLIGILSGTYSSIYNASPILYLIDRKIAKTNGEQLSLVSMAKQEVALQSIISPVAAAPEQVSPSGRSYGQVRRRANAAPTKRDDLDL